MAAQRQDKKSLKRKIVFLTGTRADFGKLKPLINRVEHSSEFDCFIFVTGMHTLSKYGFTYDEVRKQNYKEMFVFINQTHSTEMDIILANTIMGFSNFINEIKPDLIVVHGDRVEALAGAIVGAFNNRLVAHIEGGEVSGTIDEIIRHAITKLAHTHFVANDVARRRLVQMGENEKTLFVIGSPDIDIMLSNTLPSLPEVKRRYEIPYERYAVFCYHPVTTELDSLKHDIKNVVSALIQSRKNYVVIYPNNDNGSEIIIKEIETLQKNRNFRVLPSMRFEYFLTLLKNAEFVIGNSSSGIREAGIYGVPTVNIGTRQQNRSKSRSIINVPAVHADVLKAIAKTNNLKVKKTFEFGKGNSAEKFFKIITVPSFWKIPCQKQFVDQKLK